MRLHAWLFAARWIEKDHISSTTSGARGANGESRFCRLVFRPGSPRLPVLGRNHALHAVHDGARIPTEEDWAKLCAHLGGDARKLIGAPFNAVVPAGWRQIARGKPVGWLNSRDESTWACSVTTHSLKRITIDKTAGSIGSEELLRSDARNRVHGFSLRLIQE